MVRNDPANWCALIREIFTPALALFGQREKHLETQGVTYSNDQVMVSFVQGEHETLINLTPFPTPDSDDPDYVSLVAVLTFVAPAPIPLEGLRITSSLKEARMTFQAIADALPCASAYLLGEDVDYAPIWAKLEARKKT